MIRLKALESGMRKSKKGQNDNLYQIKGDKDFTTKNENIG